jgi:hypothetical protein
LAIAAFPLHRGAPASADVRRGVRPIATLSAQLTKKLATSESHRFASGLMRSSRPAMYASITDLYASIANKA